MALGQGRSALGPRSVPPARTVLCVTKDGRAHWRTQLGSDSHLARGPRRCQTLKPGILSWVIEVLLDVTAVKW